MKNLFLAVIAIGLIFATSCKKEEMPIQQTNASWKTSDWVLIQKNVTQDGMTGNLYQTPNKQLIMQLTKVEQTTRTLPYTGTLTTDDDGNYICPDSNTNRDCFNGSFGGEPIIYICQTKKISLNKNLSKEFMCK